MEPGQLRSVAPTDPLKATVKPRRLRRWIAGLLTATLAIGYLERAPLLTGTAEFFDVSEPPRPVDYVMVLGGGNETRPFVAAALVRHGYAHVVLLAPCRPSPDVIDGIMPSEHEILRRILQTRGVPEEAILLLDGESESTRDEAVALQRFLQTRPAVQVAVVTNMYHTRRARDVFRRILGNRGDEISFVAAPADYFDARNWWKSERGMLAYTNEMAKFVFYRLRY